jgi:PAS domain S-box-containing protein
MIEPMKYNKLIQMSLSTNTEDGLLKSFSVTSAKANRSAIKQLESGMSESENETRFLNLIESISEVIYEVDGRGVVTYVNRAIEKLTGYSPGEVIGKSIVRFLGDYTFLQEKLKLSEENNIITGEHKILSRKGDVCWVRLSVNPLFEEGVFCGATGTLIDITDKKKEETDLRKMKRSTVCWRRIYLMSSGFTI